MKTTCSILILFLISTMGWSQQQITLERCYDLVTENYPLAKQKALLENKNDLEIDAIETTKLPQLHLDAQASYLSDVTQVPIPNSGIEPPNNDQYRATLSVNQLLYHGGSDRKSTRLNSSHVKISYAVFCLKKKKKITKKK